MKKSGFIFLIFLNCKTMTLNQKGDTLDKGRTEISGVSNLGVGLSLRADTINGFTFGEDAIFPDIIFSLGIQYRQSIRENVEYQFKIDDFIYFLPVTYPATEFLFENYFKFRLHKSENTNFSILPYFGIGMILRPTNPPYPQLNFTTGFKLIGDCKNFYYGFPIGIGYNCNNFQVASYPDIEYGFALGGERIYKEKLVIRNEFAFTVKNEFFRFGIKGTAIYTYITASYSIAIGKKF